jgi:hypothetical protein
MSSQQPSARCTRRLSIAGVLAGTVMIGLAALPAAAHSQLVQPPSKDAPVVAGPISNAWAQAHCHAASPGLVAERSNGVVQFIPAGALPCSPVPNPGGQVHP